MHGAHAEIAIVLNSADQNISLVDTVSYKEIRRIPTGKEPHHLMATADDQLIIANAAGNELVFLDPNTGNIQRRLPGISDPYQIGFSPDRKWFVSASNRLDRIDVYEANGFKLAKRFTTGKVPSHIAFDAASQFAFVTLQESDQLTAINLQKLEVAWTIPIGKRPAGIWMTPDDKYLLVAATGADYVDVIDWRTRITVKRIKTANGAHNFVALGDKQHVFVSNRMANSISLVDMKTMSEIAQFAAPGGPDCMWITRDQKQLWYTGRFSRSVRVVDLTNRKVIHSIPVGRSPHGVYFKTHAPLQ